MRTYAEVLAELYRREGKDAKFCIERVEDAARCLGSPQKGLRAVHVAGSNGKGSVTSMVALYLQKAGYRTGKFTSPHLHRFTERIQVDGREIPRRDVVRLFGKLEGHIARGSLPWLTFFEIATLMGFRWFRERRVDVAAIEVGLGGRLDATNVLTGMVGAITSISLEHTRILGPTLSHVAAEKAGILKPGMPVVLGRMPATAERVIVDRARGLGCEAWRFGREFGMVPCGQGRLAYEGPGLRLEGLTVSLEGRHQLVNAGVAVAIAQILESKGYPLDVRALSGALADVRWPGRLERLASDPEVVMDVAHNPEGIRTLVKAMAGRRFHVVFGGMADKPLLQMIRILAPITARLYITAPDVPRALRPADYPSVPGASRFDAVERAVDAARERAALGGGAVLVTGSIFTVSVARAHVLGLDRVDPLITS